MMYACLMVEWLKLRRSLASLLAVAAPALVAVFVFFNLLRTAQPPPLEQTLRSAAAVWAFFMLPMTITALSALLAQMEHAPRTWDHLNALPLPRWQPLLAKLAAILVLVAGMSAAVPLLAWLAAGLAALLRPAAAIATTAEPASIALLMGRMFLSALLLMAIQLWTALRFSSFVPSLALGIGGTFFAVVANGARAGVFMPWQMPINQLAAEPWRAHAALLVGAVGGGVAMLIMLMDLSRLERR